MRLCAFLAHPRAVKLKVCAPRGVELPQCDCGIIDIQNTLCCPMPVDCAPASAVAFTSGSHQAHFPVVELHSVIISAQRLQRVVR